MERQRYSRATRWRYFCKNPTAFLLTAFCSKLRSSKMDPALLTALSGTAQRASRPGKAARASGVCTAPARASRSPRQVLTSPPGAQLFSLTWLQVHAASWSAVKEDISAFSCRRPKPESIPLSGLASACILQPGFYVPRFLRNPRQGDSCGRTAALLGHLVTQRSDGRDQAPVAQFSSCRTWLGSPLGLARPGQVLLLGAVAAPTATITHPGFCRGHGHRL